MRDDNPGDLSIRIGFARVYGGGPDQGALRPSLEITDGTSNKRVVVELAAAEIAELLSGSEVRVPAARVAGFKDLQDFGKYHHMVTAHVKTESGDWKIDESADPRSLPHVAKAMEEIEGAGYGCDRPRRNNQQQWVIVGRKYTDDQSS